MSNLLLITSSLFGENSKSRQIAEEFLGSWQHNHPGAEIVRREVSALPHLGPETLVALATPAEQRNEAQARAVARADALIEELEAADTVVLAVPMYNFSVPSTLKAWIDHVARAGRTFRYAAEGPQGLLGGKKVYVVVSRGGLYSGDAPARGLDFQEPYLRAVLGFLGLADISFIHVEGLNISPDHAAQGLERARRRIAELLPAEAAA